MVIIKNIKNAIISVADIPSTMNIAIMDDTQPRKAVLELKYLKEGLKLGAEPIFNKKQARLVTIKVMRKAIVINVAI